MRRSFNRERGATALIAIKERGRCKTRLAPALDESARIALVRAMLGTVIAATRGAELVERTIVVSPERDEVPLDIPVLADSGSSLNEALTQAHSMLRELDCHEILVLPADLPGITAQEVDAVIRTGRVGGFAIAPDLGGHGTNALYVRAAEPFPFHFGPNSHSLHEQAARRLGLLPRVIRSRGLELDVDSPSDLALLDDQTWPTRLRA